MQCNQSTSAQQRPLAVSVGWNRHSHGLFPGSVRGCGTLERTSDSQSRVNFSCYRSTSSLTVSVLQSPADISFSVCHWSFHVFLKRPFVSAAVKLSQLTLAVESCSLHIKQRLDGHRRDVARVSVGNSNVRGCDRCLICKKKKKSVCVCLCTGWKYLTAGII